MPNILGGILIASLAFAPLAFPKDGNQQQYYFILGIVMLILLAGLWPFDVAVSSQYVDTCQMRLLYLFDNPATAFLGQFVDRIAASTNAALTCQALCWCTTYIFYNTGEMPKKYDVIAMTLGLIYTIVIGTHGMSSSASCLSIADLYNWDVAFPACSGFLMFLYIIRYKRRDSQSVQSLKVLKRDTEISALGFSASQFLWVNYPTHALPVTGFTVFGQEVLPGHYKLDFGVHDLSMQFTDVGAECMYQPVDLETREWPVRALGSLAVKAGIE